MPPKFKRHLNDDDVTGSVKSERRNLLEEDSDEEEDFFLRGPSGPRFGPKNDKIRHVQNQVDEVIDVMQENITKVIERGERLDDLQDKSDEGNCGFGCCWCPASDYCSPHPQIPHLTCWWILWWLQDDSIGGSCVTSVEHNMYIALKCVPPSPSEAPD
uniref:Vesicle associated membrane protein 4 n=1 Tax=Podarcis muralis TaxID=64176 RepID=A0A670HSR6_PODMU|nr:vesicle-associated membrane protein 4 isoform X1 [Podarcis muralis]XP_028588111.1 vesicle-associated membrane protein 4 isoform X1 [Podarcis muralis]